MNSDEVKAKMQKTRDALEEQIRDEAEVLQGMRQDLKALNKQIEEI